MTSDETGPVYEVVVHYAGNHQIIETNGTELPGILRTLRQAIDDAWVGKPPYFCQCNSCPIKTTADGVKGVWANVIRSDKIDGYYVRRIERESFAERQIKLQEKLLKAVEKSVDDADRGDEWKQGGDDAD